MIEVNWWLIKHNILCSKLSLILRIIFGFPVIYKAHFIGPIKLSENNRHMCIRDCFIDCRDVL